ncbi:hypothetical protein QD712_25720 [Streptomyces acidiscabies]|uniref:hypothetical protein n=1 Tax=Streptomyces acidiscabies TaxID=42234 RepID=UPI0030CEE097
MERTHQPHPQPSPRRRLVAAGYVRRTPRPAAPLPPAALTAIARLERALDPTLAVTAAKVGAHLGYGPDWEPRAYLGETPTHLIYWDQHQLDAAYGRVGGTVTIRTVQRPTETWTATEITVTVHVPDVGDVTLTTDWDEDSGGHDLPLMHAARLANLHQQCRDDYVSNASRRAQDHRDDAQQGEGQ